VVRAAPALDLAVVGAYAEVDREIDGFTDMPTRSLPAMAVVEVTGGGQRWEARDGTETVGVLRAAMRPDRRTFLSFQDCRDDAYAPLLARAAGELDRPVLYTSVHERDEVGLRRLGELGFIVNRRDHHYRIPVDPARFRLPDAAPPPGIVLISAAAADLDRLRLLDDTLRSQTPGSDGWRWNPSQFSDETFSDGFDPATYLVAVDQRTGAYVGLARLWMKPAGPRFGFVGVLPPWRRTRVTYALLSTVCQELNRRGNTQVAGEIDATNQASNALAARAGAVRIGGSYELVRDVTGRRASRRATSQLTLSAGWCDDEPESR
jgi:GNAT superfamily N-acetyltransferase